MKKFILLSKLNYSNPKLLTLLHKSIKNHKKIEEEFFHQFKEFINEEAYASSTEKLPLNRYFERNFFSILMLSIFQNLDIDENKIINYGLSLHSLRGIVTASDNIIDNENKGFVDIHILKNRILKNSMLSIICQNILNNNIDKLAKTPKEKNSMIYSYTNALYQVALGESKRELKDSIESPDKIIEDIHKKIGGELLQLAFVLPMIADNSKNLSKAREGIFEIGIALQILDDLCDLKEDLLEEKKNYLFSHILYHNNISFNELVNLSKEDEFLKDSRFEKSYHEGIILSIDKALKGFSLLKESGYPINSKESKYILEFMFNNRGLNSSWEYYAMKKG